MRRVSMLEEAANLLDDWYRSVLGFSLCGVNWAYSASSENIDDGVGSLPGGQTMCDFDENASHDCCQHVLNISAPTGTAGIRGFLDLLWSARLVCHRCFV